MSTATQEPVVSLPVNWQEIAREALKEKRDVSVSKDEVASALQWLQKSRASYAQVLRPAKKGDAIEIDFELSSEGKKIEGGETKNHTLILGEGNHIPGFEDALIGMKAGEEKNFSLEDKGKHLDFQVKINSVKDRILPELNDEFTKSLGKFGNLESLRASIREGLLTEKSEKERQRIRILMLAMIDDKSKIDIPGQSVRDELQSMLAELKASLASMGLTLEEYLKQIKKTAEELEKDFYPEAVRRVRYALILREIAREGGIEPSEEEVKAESNKFLLRLSSPQKAQKAIDAQSLLRYTRNILRNEKTFEWLEKLAS